MLSNILYLPDITLPKAAPSAQVKAASGRAEWDNPSSHLEAVQDLRHPRAYCWLNGGLRWSIIV